MPLIHALRQKVKDRPALRRALVAAALLAGVFMFYGLFLLTAKPPQYVEALDYNEEAVEQGEPPEAGRADGESEESDEEIAEVPEYTGPVYDESREIVPALRDLRAESGNKNIIGRLQIEGTAIDYTVVQGADNEYYLEHNADGNESRAGAIFMDYACDPAVAGRHTVVYGHCLENGRMFSALAEYQDRIFFEEHRYVRLTLLHEETVWEAFAYYVEESDFAELPGAVGDEAFFRDVIDEIAAKSLYDTGVTVGLSDSVLTLATCIGDDVEGRFVLCAKLVSRVAVENMQ
jgi:sortase B